MSTSAIASGMTHTWLAWEAQDQVRLAAFDAATGKTTAPQTPPDQEIGAKHPALAISPKGQVLLAWTTRMKWSKGGGLQWQLFDNNGKPIDSAAGKARGVPAWSLITAFPRKDGGFVIIY
jgi:hypothetical protein